MVALAVVYVLSPYKTTATVQEGGPSSPLTTLLFKKWKLKSSLLSAQPGTVPSGTRVLSWAGRQERCGQPGGCRQLGLRTGEGKEALRSSWLWEMWWGQFCSGCPQHSCKMSGNGNLLKANMAVGGKARFCNSWRDSNFLLQTPAPPPLSLLPLFSPLKPSLLSQLLVFFSHPQRTWF